jgi:hypothetical protein
MFDIKNIPQAILNMDNAGYTPVWIEAAIRHCYPGLPEDFYLSIKEVLK